MNPMELEKSKGIPQDWDDVKRLVEENRRLKQKLSDVSKVALRLLDYVKEGDEISVPDRPLYDKAIATLRRMLE